jgi:hypothetical protein
LFCKKQIGDQLFQVELDITERIGKPEPVGRVDGVKELLVAEEGQMEIFNDISRSRKEIEEESLETEKLFINKHKEILVEVQERIDGVEKEERDIQEKWKEASKDIEESKKPIAESGAEDQQKEKLQTKLEKLTAQKNAIEQKKQALLIERLTIEMEMSQERLMKLETIIDMALKVIFLFLFECFPLLPCYLLLRVLSVYPANFSFFPKLNEVLNQYFVFFSLHSLKVFSSFLFVNIFAS